MDSDEGYDYGQGPVLDLVGSDGYLDESKIPGDLGCVFTYRRTGFDLINKPNRVTGALLPRWSYVGMPAVEVFSLNLFNPSDKALKVFGKVEYSSDRRSTLIYNAPASKGQIVLPKRWISLLLTGPDLVDCNASLEMSACLGDVFESKIINTAWIRIKERTMRPMVKFLGHRHKMYNDDGQNVDVAILVVCFVVYKKAVGAKVIVELTSDSGPLYGTITAASSEFPDYKSRLFYKKKNKEKVTMGLIPLSKSVVAVPITGTFTIYVNLPDIVEGDATFKFEKLGPSEPKDIDGKVRVTVIWMV